jgi:pimeloyl-ACP methyl ester carboxylesterase
MVLLHGFTDTWRAWTAVLPALEARHDVLALTLPGHYGGHPFEQGMAFELGTMLDLIEAEMDGLGFERAHLVGSSLGGWLCLELALRGRALSVVGVCPAGGWEPGSRPERAILRYFRRNALMLRAGRRWLPMISRRPRLRVLAMRELVARPSRLSATDAMTMMEGAAECVIANDAITAARSQSLFGELGAIDCPVRILYGTRDVLVRWPSHFEKLRRILPEADYVALDGLGHLPMWDDPARVARMILEVTERDLTSAPAGT